MTKQSFKPNVEEDITEYEAYQIFQLIKSIRGQS